MTDDVDLLVTAEGLTRVHEKLDGLGYVPPFTGSKQLRDTRTGVKIEFLTTGGYPGDGQPKPVAFPDPESSCVAMDGIRYLDMPSLVTLKLASGMTAAHRGHDLMDIQKLIRVRELPVDFAEQLPEYVREKFVELHGYANTPDPFDQG